MNERRFKSGGGILLASAVILLAILACQTPEHKETPVTSSTPEKTTEMGAYEIRKASDEIKKDILPNNFLSCGDGEEKEGWYGLFERNGEKQLFEFVHSHDVKSLYKEKLWRFEPEGILPRDILNSVTYQGYIVFALFDPENDQNNFLYKYDRKNSKWQDGENFEGNVLSKYGLPSKIHVRKKKGVWEFESTQGSGWTTKFPFEKPKTSCQVLKSEKLLQSNNIQLLGPEATPSPSPEEELSEDDMPCDGEGYLNEGANLRSAPRLGEDKKVEIWHKNSELEILSVIEGDAGKESDSTTWYKVKMLKGACDHPPYCRKEGYIHSSLVNCLSDR